jgi:hypothetical protein
MLRERLVQEQKRRDEHTKAVEAAQAQLSDVMASHAEWVTQKAHHDQRKARVAAAQRDVDGLEQQARAIADQQKQWDERQRLIDQPVDGPELADVEAAQQAASAQREVVEVARRKERELFRQAEEALLAHKLEIETLTAQQYEQAATSGLKALIGNVLAARKIDGWHIEDGVLMCHSPRVGKLIPFSDLSRSTQDTAALRLYIEHMPVEPSAQYHLILLPQEAFDGTTSQQRREMSRIAEAAGRYVLSAMVSEDGELKVVKV